MTLNDFLRDCDMSQCHGGHYGKGARIENDGRRYKKIALAHIEFTLTLISSPGQSSTSETTLTDKYCRKSLHQISHLFVVRRSPTLVMMVRLVNSIVLTKLLRLTRTS